MRSSRAGERVGLLMHSLQPGGSPPMDAIALLLHDHREVEQLFRQFEKLTERAHKSKQKIVMKVIRELAIHSADRKSTRLNSSHGYISYAVFCLKKKNKQKER